MLFPAQLTFNRFLRKIFKRWGEKIFNAEAQCSKEIVSASGWRTRIHPLSAAN